MVTKFEVRGDDLGGDPNQGGLVDDGEGGLEEDLCAVALARCFMIVMRWLRLCWRCYRCVRERGYPPWQGEKR